MSATQVDFPEKAEKAAPKEKDTIPSTGIANWADNEETVKKVLDRAVAWFTKFDAQANRDKMEEDIKNADEMFMMSFDQTKQDENKTRDAVDTVPDAAFRALRAVTANDNEAMYGADELGVSYDPLETLTGDSRDEAMRYSEEQKILLEYSFEADDRKELLRDSQWYVNKNCNALFGIEWHKEELIERERNDNGRFVERKVIKQHPHVIRWDLDKVWLDAMIKRIEDQQAFLMRDYPSMSELVKRQADGEYKNIDQLGPDQLFSSEQPSDTARDIQKSAGSDGNSDEPTGQFDRWRVVMYAPINDDGEWDEKNQYGRRIFATFVGHITSGNPVCVSLTKNQYDPNDTGHLNFYWQSSHWDERTKGAYSRGFFHFIWPTYQEYKTTLDQWFDNKNLQMNSGWITEKGAIHTADKTFGPRRLFEMQMGLIDKLKRLDVPSVTGDMQAFIAYLEARIKETAGITDAFLGEAMGSRTSAQESRQALAQSVKPASDRLRSMGGLLKWIAEWDMRMWRMFADPELVLALVDKDKVKEVKPAMIHGPLRVRVSAIDDFENNLVVQREQNAFLRDTFPMIKDVMPKRDIRATLRWIYRKRGFPVDELWGPDRDGDAVRIARGENMAFERGIWDQPASDENHDIHIGLHEDAESMFKRMPPEDLHPDTLRFVNAHVEMHRQLQRQEMNEAQNAAQAALGPSIGSGQPGAAPPRTDAELEGDRIAGEAGTIQ